MNRSESPILLENLNLNRNDAAPIPSPQPAHVRPNQSDNIVYRQPRPEARMRYRQRQIEANMREGVKKDVSIGCGLTGCGLCVAGGLTAFCTSNPAFLGISAFGLGAWGVAIKVSRS